MLFEQANLVKQIATFLRLASIRDAEAVLKAIEAQHGLLVERADELWSFSHLTFQEHFTSQWLTQLSSEQLAEKIVNQQWQEVVKQLVKFQQTSDRLLRLIKQAIDYSVSQDAKLQKFLTWVQKKSESVKTSYKRTAVRAFYFSLDLNLDSDPYLDSKLANVLELTNVLDFARYCTRPLVRDRTLFRLLDYPSFRYRPLNRPTDGDLVYILDRDFYIDISNDIERDSNHFRVFYQGYRGLSDGDSLDPVQDPDPDPILALKLQRLGAQLPRALFRKQEKFEHWWRTNGKIWGEELRQVIIEHRNIGHDWQFTEAQTHALQRYYDSNKFLVELLKQPGAVSDTVRQEIEDNLLLPIATLRERLPELYGE